MSDIRPIYSEVESVRSGILEYTDSEDRDLIVAYGRLNNEWLVVIMMSKRDVLIRTYDLFKLMIYALVDLAGVFSIFCLPYLLVVV